MKKDEDWKRLIKGLDSWTSASEIAEGRIEVALTPVESTRRVVVVMTPDQWSRMTGTMWGNFDDAFQDVKRTLLALQPHEGFAVSTRSTGWSLRLSPPFPSRLSSPPSLAVNGWRMTPTVGSRVASRTSRSLANVTDDGPVLPRPARSCREKYAVVPMSGLCPASRGRRPAA